MVFFSFCRRKRVAYGYCQRGSGHGQSVDGQRSGPQRTVFRQLYEHRRPKSLEVGFTRPRMGKPVSGYQLRRVKAIVRMTRARKTHVDTARPVIVCHICRRGKKIPICIVIVRSYVYWGEYPLSFAACLGQEESYRLMLARGADPNNQDTNGNTVLHMLVIYEKIVIT